MQEEIIALKNRVDELEIARKEHRLLTQALAKSDMRWSDVQRMTRMGHWEWDVVNNHLYWSEGIYDIYQLDPAEHEATYQLFLKFIHPEDRATVEQAIVDSLAQNKPYKADFRILLQDGSVRYLNCNAEVSYDKRKKPMHMMGVCRDVTDITLAQRAQLKSEERWRLLVAHAPNIIVTTDLNASIEFSNHTIGEFNPEEIVGKSLFDFIAAGSQPELKMATDYTLETGKTTRCELSSGDLSSEESWYSTDIAAIYDDADIVGLQLIFVDITDQKQTHEELEKRVAQRTQALEAEISARVQAENALRKSEELYRTVTTISPVGIFRTDFEGENVYVNQCWSEITGLPADCATQMAWHQGVHPEDKERVLSEWKQRPRHEGLFKTEYRFVRNDGSVVWVLGQTMPVKNADGTVGNYVGTITDITKLREAEERARQRQAELAHFLRLTTMGEMASSLAHELNQPLAAVVNYIGGCLTHLRQFTIPQQIIDGLEHAARQAEYAGAVIHRLKDFLHKGNLSKVKIDVNDIVEDAVMLMKMEAKSAETDLEVNLSENLPQIHVDKTQIEQVIFNLMHNAIDAMERAVVAKRQIQISTMKCEHGGVEVVVSDTGPGIATEILTQIFEPFFTTRDEGMGMGLSISRSIAEAHGGRILVDTNQQRPGTSFHLCLPFSSEVST
jgi:PAS domain S-box-containing protein